MSKNSLPVFIAVSCLGISSIITQITLTRELLNIYQGNELVIGFIISFWLILTGVGTFLGRYQFHIKFILVHSLILTALIPFGQLLLLRLFRNTIALPGSTLELFTLFPMILLIMFPYCLLSGYLLPIACALFKKQSGQRHIGRIYFVDNLGDILGGLLFSFLLVFIMSSFNALYVPCLLNLTAALIICITSKYKKTFFYIIAIILFVIASTRFGLDETSISWLFPSQHIIQKEESVYGRLVVTKDAEQLNFFENGVPLASSHNQLIAEKTVHFSLSQVSEDNLNVLLISGGLTGAIQEIQKYPVRKIDYIELDPVLIQLTRQFAPTTFSQYVEVHITDGRKFINESKKKYHAIIIALPAPVNIQLNRFYTLEFFIALKQRLHPGGVVSFTLPGAENYYPLPLVQLYRIIHSTAKNVFSHVKLYPGGETVFVLANHKLTNSISDLLTRKQIKTSYMNQYYMKSKLSKDRVDEINNMLKGTGEINRDLYPTAFRTQLKYWGLFHQVNFNWLWGFLIAVSLLLFLFYRPIESVLFTTGYISIAMEIILIILSQASSGYVYYKYGLFITIFMTGLAAGSYLSSRKNHNSIIKIKNRLLYLELGLIITIGGLIFITAIPLLWKQETILFLLVFCTATLTGSEFAWAGQYRCAHKPPGASSLYTADFLGAGIGSLLTSALFIPTLGIQNTIFILLCVKLTGFLKLWKFS
ncbi:MAG: fused MFS/spermidine synthase [Fibrobacteria bacterium]|nr:fused MFS/spermidine synthase [Fibrobacteria bacterium]